MLFFSILFFSVSCEEEQTISDEQAAKNAVKEIMEEWYYWYEKMPEVKINDYQDVYYLLNAMMYTEKDVWSFIMPYDEFIQYYSEASYEGYGFGFKEDENNNVFITFVFKDSPLYAKGVRRGWQLIELDDELVTDLTTASQLLSATVQSTFAFIRPQGDTVSYSFQKKTITQNTVLHSEIIDTMGTKIGYMVLQSFVTPTLEEVDDVFQDFSAKGIDEMILDLRYNGGGDASVASYLASSIIDQDSEGDLFVKYQYNDKKHEYNEEINFEKSAYKLNLDRLMVITMEGTASASEMIVKGLEPYINVKLVGHKTHGKPVGMNVFDLQEYGYAFAPVTFKIVNNSGDGDYFNGIPVDATINDDITRQFGDRHEDCLEECIYYILNSSFSSKSFKTIPIEQPLHYKGFDLILQAE